MSRARFLHWSVRWHWGGVAVVMLGAASGETLIHSQLHAGRSVWQQEVTSQRLNDGVVLWQRTPSGGGVPRFFQQMRALFRRSPPRLPFDESIAFLVGVESYRDPRLHPLPFVRNDLDDVRRYLLDAGGFDKVYVASGAIASQTLVSAYMLDSFPKLRDRDRLLFYFSGHGQDGRGTTGYMLFGGADYNSVSHDALPIDFSIKEWATVIRVKHILFVIDACASGLRETPKSGSEDQVALTASALSGAGSRTLITAGTANQRTFEVQGAGHGNGVFTRALLDALQSSEDPIVSVYEAYDQVLKQVSRATPQGERAPSPQLWRFQTADYPGTFVFMNPGARRKDLPDRYQQALGLTYRGADVVGERATGWDQVTLDTFPDGDLYSWGTGRGSDDSVTFDIRKAGNKYRWETTFRGQRELWRGSPYGSLVDFSVTVDARMVEHTSNSAVGIYFGSAFGRWWEFQVTPDGRFSLWRRDGTSTEILGWTRSRVAWGETNRLGVQVQNNRIKLQLNGVTVSDVQDPLYAGGTLGLEIQSWVPGRAVVEYANFELRSRELPDRIEQAPGLTRGGPEIEELPTGWERVVFDTFPDDSLYSWGTGHFSDDSSTWDDRKVNNKYRWEGSFRGLRGHYRGSPYGSFTDFSVAIDVRVIESTPNSAVAIYFGYAFGRWWEFRVAPNGRFALVRRDSTAFTQILDWSGSRAPWGETNRIGVQVQNNRIALRLNGVTVADLKDTLYAGGELGLSVTSWVPGRVVVEYANFDLRRKTPE